MLQIEMAMTGVDKQEFPYVYFDRPAPKLSQAVLWIYTH